jgi:hypothetical protein
MTWTWPCSTAWPAADPQLNPTFHPVDARPGRKLPRDVPGVRGRERRVVELVEQPEFFSEEEGAVEPAVGVLDCPEVASWATVWRSGAFRSDQRVPLTQRPAAVCQRSCAFHSSRGTWSVARAARATRRGMGQSKSRLRRSHRGSRAGTRRSCRSRPPGSGSCGRRARRRSPARWCCCGPVRHHTIAPVASSATDVR